MYSRVSGYRSWAIRVQYVESRSGQRCATPNPRRSSQVSLPWVAFVAHCVPPMSIEQDPPQLQHESRQDIFARERRRSFEDLDRPAGAIDLDGATLRIDEPSEPGPLDDVFLHL